MSAITHIEALIIGGGVIGLSIARELHKNGLRRITIVEKGMCGKESSWAAAGMLGPQAEADEAGPFFEFCSTSRDLFPVLAAELLEETGIDIELDRTGTLSLAFDDEGTNELIQRSRLQREGRLRHEALSAEDVLKLEPQVSPNVQFGLCFPNDWQVENRKLLEAFRRYADMNGIEVIENTKVDQLIIESGIVTGVQASAGTITSDNIVLATGAWTSLIKFGDRPAPFEVLPIRGQMIEFRPDTSLFRHVIYSRRGYVVPRLDGRILAGSTSEYVGYDKSVTQSAANDLKIVANQISQRFDELEIAGHWSGLRPFAGDGLPVIGSIKGLEGLLIATAHYRNGILLAPLTAKVITKSIVSKARSNMIELYSPDRFFRNRSASI
jgi:glycine oxidase